ncbi:MAG: hypothetical protein JWN22_1074 [Nocardioides sp.]|jgi:hypothetical protein|nr:hypothetical protein [Nocardioides sp.]
MGGQMSRGTRGSHAAPAPGGLRRRLMSVRLRAVLSLGILVAPAGVGTMAFWTDNVAISGATYTAGTLNLKVNSNDAYATTTLAMATMVPGNTSAEVLTVQNVGNVPIKYSLQGGLTGTDAAALAPDLTLTVRAGGTRTITGTGPSYTCTGGTQIYNAVLTTTTTTDIITAAAKRGPVAATSGTDALCFQVTFSATAATTQQGKTASATFTFVGTSDLS